MKIGIFDPYLDTLGGGEKYMLTVATCLAKEHTVTLFWNKTPAYEMKKQIERKFGIDIKTVSFANNIFNTDVSLLQRLSITKKYDAIFILSDGSIPFVRSKLYVHFQSPLEWINNSSLKNKIKLMRTEAIICNSHFTKKYIDRKFGCNSIVLYPPVVFPKNSIEKKENIILHVGRFGIHVAGSSYKKQDMMAETFKQMIANGLENWRLVFIVSLLGVEHEEALTKLMDSSKRMPIEFVKNPTNESLWSYYRKAKIYWHASGFGEDLAKHPERAEHFGISTIEAMGSGAVPVVINAGGQPEIVTDNENGMLWSTKAELIAKTLRLIQDTQLRGQLAKKAEASVGRFSIDSFSKQLLEIIA